MKKIEIYDTTLRDGAQSEGINFSVSDKLKIIKKLDDLGIDYIEAGWPGANPVDNEIFNKINELDLKNAKIAAFGSTRKANVKVESDNVINNLIKSNAKIVTIFGKSWDFQVTEALNTTLEENLSMIKDSIEYLISNGLSFFHFSTLSLVLSFEPSSIISHSISTPYLEFFTRLSYNFPNNFSLL